MSRRTGFWWQGKIGEIHLFLPWDPSTRNFSNSSKILAIPISSNTSWWSSLHRYTGFRSTASAFSPFLVSSPYSLRCNHTTSHRNGSGDGGKKIGLDEKLPRRVFNPLPYFAMLRKPFWRSPYCGGILYTRSGTTYAPERLLDRRASSYTEINAQVSVLRLNQLRCVLRLCRQTAEPIFQKYSLWHGLRLWWI